MAAKMMRIRQRLDKDSIMMTPCCIDALIYRRDVKWNPIHAWLLRLNSKVPAIYSPLRIDPLSSMAFNEEGMTSLDRFYEALGILGGVSLSVCTAPQIWHMYKTKDASALQKRFLILYLVGTIFTFVYLVVKDAWAAWITMILEVICNR